MLAKIVCQIRILPDVLEEAPSVGAIRLPSSERIAAQAHLFIESLYLSQDLAGHCRLRGPGEEGGVGCGEGIRPRPGRYAEVLDPEQVP